jgi:chromosome segregation ATPase
MEIIYDGVDNLRIRFDNGRELGLDEILDLDKALTLTRTSREWNRKRVVELEDALERGERKAPEDQRLYTAAEVGDAQASEAELVATPLRRRIAELERTLAREVNRNTDLEAELDQVKKDRDARLAHLDEAEQYQCERAAEYRRSVTARDHLLSAATTRLNAAREILLATAVSRARDEIVTSKGAVLADAIGNALHALEG